MITISRVNIHNASCITDLEEKTLRALNLSKFVHRGKKKESQKPANHH
jgi:hypothetical protein